MELLTNKFLCCYPVNKIDWQDVEALSWDEQFAFFNSTIHHPLNESYPIKKSYQYAFLKAFVHALETTGNEIHDAVYEELAALCRNKEDASNFTYKHYTIQTRNVVITLKESKSFISEGTTGLSSWQASLALSEWLLQNPKRVLRKKILELGAGTGLSGMVAAKCCHANKVTLTDGSVAVIKLLNENIHLNFGDNEVNLKTRLLKWEDHLELHTDQDCLPEVLLGADITYDNAVFPALINVLDRIFTSTKNTCVLYLATTIRNEDTFHQFMTLIREHDFTMTEETYVKPGKNLFWDESTPIRIFCVARHKNDSLL